jgi:hypothetical protein
MSIGVDIRTGVFLSGGPAEGIGAGGATTKPALVFLGLLLALCSPLPSLAQEPLTNETIVKLVKAGIGDDVIVGMIQSQLADFSLGADQVLALKHEGVSDKILAAMVNKAQGNSTATGNSPAGLPTEVGVYYKKGDQWQELLPDVVNWKTGGFLKSIVKML